MKKVTVFITTFCLFFLLGGIALGEILVSEDWEDGVDPLKWEIVGDPTPDLFSPGHESDTALDINGDNSCNSAAYTVQEFETAQDLVAVFWLRGNSDGRSGMTIAAGFTTGNPAPFPCEDEGYFGTFALVQLTSSSLGKGIYYMSDTESTKEDYIDDDWHKYRIEIAPDGIVSFYRDDELKYTTTQAVDLSLYPTTRFQVEGKAVSQEYPMLIDDIAISTEGISCVPDYNRDGIVNIDDLVEKGGDEANEFTAWLLLCWRPGRDCGDYNNDGVVDEIDLLEKAIHVMREFLGWMIECWLPAVRSPSPEALKEAFGTVDALKQALEKEIPSHFQLPGL